MLLMAALARVLDKPALGERIEGVLDRLRVVARTDVAPPPLITGRRGLDTMRTNVTASSAHGQPAHIADDLVPGPRGV